MMILDSGLLFWATLYSFTYSFAQIMKWKQESRTTRLFA